MEGNDEMVDSVSFGAARPLSGPRALSAADVARAGDVRATPAPTAPQHMSLAAALAHEGPPFDAEKVAALRAAIADGTYTINLGRLADGMIRFGNGDLA